MPEFTSYSAGTPCWVDLASPDVAASLAFYGPLFGWEGEDQGEEAGHYTMLKLRGKAVGAVTPPMGGEGQPPAWTTYVSVDDADATVKAAKAAGGTVFVEPMDVMTVGRMAVMADPSGAVIAIWQPRDFAGAELANETGSLCWNELQTRDTKAAAPFYQAVFGWKPEAFEGMGEYTVFNAGDRGIGGMMPMPAEVPPQVPPHWLVYFAVDDCDATVAQATGLGGATMVPPMDIPPGRFSVLADPHGAVFAVIKPNPME
jgi:uncharacterized protein